MRHARWNSLIKGIWGSHLSIPYDLPAPVKVTYRLWCLQFAVLLMQSWPPWSDVLLKVVNDYHLSMCFSRHSGNPPLPLHRKDFFFCGCQCFDLISSSSKDDQSPVRSNSILTTNLLPWCGCETQIRFKMKMIDGLLCLSYLTVSFSSVIFTFHLSHRAMFSSYLLGLFL